VLAGALDGDDRVVALALGNSVGMTVLGLALVGTAVHRAGRGVFTGLASAALVASGAAAASGALGWWLARLWSGGGVPAALAQAVVVGVVVALVCLGSMLVLAREATLHTVHVLRRQGLARAHE
jgi:putative peptidoglycan lipid II flippase